MSNLSFLSSILSPCDPDTFEAVKAAFDGLRHCMLKSQFLDDRCRQQNLDDLANALFGVYCGMTRVDPELVALCKWPTTTDLEGSTRALLLAGQTRVLARDIISQSIFPLANWDRVRLRTHVGDFLGAFLEAIRPIEADNRADTPKKAKRPSVPRKQDVRDYLAALRNPKNKGKTQEEIAMQITKDDERRAKSIVRQARRFEKALEDVTRRSQ